MRGRVLVVAGSDSGGGAGIQADIKTVMALGGFATTAVTALTAQNTIGVQGIFAVPPEFVGAQIDSVMDDIGADAVKTGMLGSPEIVETVASALARYGAGSPGLPVVVDPVMVAKGGAPLLDSRAVDHVKRTLLPLAAIVTPNVLEAEILCGFAIADRDAMIHAAETLLTLGVPAVLLKGGHLPGPIVVDVLATESGCEIFEGRRIETAHTHGTGCTLASAIATGLAQHLTLSDATRRAREYVRAAIAAAPGLGRGHGPMDHSVGLPGFQSSRDG